MVFWFMVREIWLPVDFMGEMITAAITHENPINSPLTQSN